MVDRHECPFEIEDSEVSMLISDMYIKVRTGGSRTLDRVYSESYKYYRYLRYGLTFIELLDKNSETEIIVKDALIARKGLMRVFELKIDYILQDIHTINDNNKIISQKDYNIRQYIVGEAFDMLSPGLEKTSQDVALETENDLSNTMQIELCHYVQTDGINAQFSWSSDLECWVIGSYTVAILARTRDDLVLYPGYGKTINDMDKTEIRYNYVHLIASVWFDMLDKLSTNDEYNNPERPFHSWLSTRTLVGELVGVSRIQQIMKYPRASIIFSSSIDNGDSNVTCMLPEICSKF